MDPVQLTNSQESSSPKGPKKPGDLTLLTKAKPKSKDKGTPKKRAVSALRGVGAVTTSAADSLIAAKQKRLLLPPTNDGASVVRMVSRFRQLERDLDTLPKEGFQSQQLREEHDDIKERLVAKGYAAKLVALKEWKESGSDPNNHPDNNHGRHLKNNRRCSRN
jgi:hypothetical protein